MQRTFIVLLTTALLAIPLLPSGTTGLPGVEYELILACPEQVAECPSFAVDGSDAMGAPAIAVDPDRPEHMIIASLHGFPDNSGAPSPKSRDGQAYTTFTSQNSGRSWTDNPFTPPNALGPDAYGEYPAITIDPYGHVFIGSLYSVRSETGDWHSVIAAQKFLSIGDINSNQDGIYNVEYLRPIHANNTIEQLWFEYNPVTDNMTMVWHETAPDTADAADPEPDDNGTSPLPIHMPRLKSAQQLQSNATNTTTNSTKTLPPTTPPIGRIGVVWTTADVTSAYNHQPVDHSISPCSDSTNPVIAENWLYIGCKVSDGEGPLKWDPASEPGDIAMFRMHPDGGEPEYLGTAPVSGGAPKIGVRSDGRIALMTTAVTDGKLRLDGTFGQYDEDSERIKWNKVQHYASNIPPLPSETVLKQSNVQAMIYREYSGVIQLVLKRYVERPDEDPAIQHMDALEPEIFKSIIAIDEALGPLAYIDLEVGDFNVRSRDPDLLAYTDEAYNDDADDFLELPPGPFRYKDQNLGVGYQREFFAIGDYGVIAFAEIIEKTTLRGPLWAAPPPPPPPPVPAPAPAGALALAGAGALTATAIIAGASTAVKRKHVSGAGKKKRP